MESEPCSGQPSTSRNNLVSVRVYNIAVQDSGMNIQENLEEHFFGIFYYEWLFGNKIYVKDAKAQQKKLRAEFLQDLQDSTNSDPDFINTIITGDKY